MKRGKTSYQLQYDQLSDGRIKVSGRDYNSTYKAVYDEGKWLSFESTPNVFGLGSLNPLSTKAGNIIMGKYLSSATRVDDPISRIGDQLYGFETLSGVIKAGCSYRDSDKEPDKEPASAEQ